MTKFIVFFLLLLTSISTHADDRENITATLDALHSAAAKADHQTYFNLFTVDAIYIGTDAGEYWTLDAFKAYAMPYMSQGKGWKYTMKSREVTTGSNGNVAWFHEILESENYGTSRGTGVLVKGADAKWRIAQYHLTFPMPNDLAKGFVKQIMVWEKTEGLRD